MNNKNTNEKNTNEDVISNLPEDILLEFLRRLPLRDAVRTSALSREWRDKWRSIQELVLNYDAGCFKFPYHDYQICIYQVVLNHRGTIMKFSLKVPPFMRHSTIDQLILHLSRNHHVRDFTLAPYRMVRYRMTSHFFAFRELTVLRLSQCTLTPPPQFQGFKNLVKIVFHEVLFLPAAFERFISQCPRLESLSLSSKSNLDSLEVAGPSLRIFACHGFVKSIHFKSCPVLAQVTLCTPCYCRKHMILSSTKASSYQRLLQFTSAGHAPNQFPSLKVLDLSMSLNSTKEFTDAFSFIRHSQNLETLIFRLWQRGWDANVLVMIQEQETPNPYLSKLKKIELHCYSGTVHQTKLLKYLLTSATGLEYMVIVPASNYKPSVDLRVQTMEYPWASPAARLIVRSPPTQK
ncbi:hypothetical protein ABFS82_04G066200 [Erythranthe guttata]